MADLSFHNKALLYEWCGKFQAPSPEWMHMSRHLTNYELMAVTEGTLYIADSSQRYAVKPGEYLLMPPTPSQYGYQASACSFYWLHFLHCNDDSTTARADEDSAAKPGNPALLVQLPTYGKLPSPDRVIILMKQLQDCARRYHNPPLNDSLTMAIISEIACQARHDSPSEALHPKSQLMNDITDYIQYSIGAAMKIEEIADYFGYNGKYLSALFKKQTGISIKQYILNQKMEHAMAELTDTNRTISQIAYDVGYDDVHNFTNAFKKIAGISPSKYRESYDKRTLFHE